jgi:transcriptional regulator with XRE-family HTH domain
MSYRDPIEEAAFQHFRTNVRALRLAAGLTLKKTAECADMHWLHLQKIEEGQINVTLVTLARLAQVLGVDAAALLGEPPRQVN